MLYKITTKSQISNIKGKLPLCVIHEAARAADILDTYYNSQDIDGGYIIIAENEADLITVKQGYLDYTSEICEFTDYIQDWVSILYLIGTEYSITLITKSEYISCKK